MAPKRGRKSEEKTSDATDSQTTHRRSGRISALNAGKPPAAPAIKPPAKKAKKVEEKKPPSKKAEVKVKTEGKEKAVAEEAPEESEEAPEEVLEEAEGESEEEEKDSGRTIVIEHCKQCRCFSKAAGQVQAGLEAGIPGINVVINPEKPRRGCFEVREEGGEAFISLQDLKRPFQKLKALDMDDVTSDILKKLQ